MKRRFVDIHHHILYSMDDGASSRKQMYAMLKNAAEDGIGSIVSTPHVTPGVKYFDYGQYRKSLKEANDYCSDKGLDLKLYEGAEILYTDQTASFLRDERIPTMAGTNRVLVEFSPDVEYKNILSSLERILCEGFVPIIAHVERCQCLVKKPDRVIEIKDEMNVLLQMNCGAILNTTGLQQRHFIREMLDIEMIDAIGTDAHNMTTRSVNMYDAWDFIREKYSASYAKRLTNGSILQE